MLCFEYIDLYIYSVFVVFNMRYNWIIWFGLYNMWMVDFIKVDDSILRLFVRLVKCNFILGL